MRRLFLCLAAIAATNAYYLTVQELMLKGDRITNGDINCNNIEHLLIGDKDSQLDCFSEPNKDDATKTDTVKVVYSDGPIGPTNAASISSTITLKDGETIDFTLQPDMKKTATKNEKTVTGKFKPLDTPPAATTPATTTAPHVYDCANNADDKKEKECICRDISKYDECTDFCNQPGGKNPDPYQACNCLNVKNKDKNFCKCGAPYADPDTCTPAAPNNAAAVLLGKQLDCAGADKKKKECLCQLAKNNAQCTDFCRTADVSKYSACACALYSNFKEDYCKCTGENTPVNCRAETSFAVASAMCQKATMAGKHPCISFCQDAKNANYAACTPSNVSNNIKAVRKTVPRLRPIDATVSATVNVDDLPAPVRLRGPGPVHPPTVEDEEEVRRVKRDASNDIQITVYYYVLDEPGNAAAVWAAVIEGIILLLFVGACFWFFFWAPRSRAAQSAAAPDPYKDTPNYSVSYANSGYNQRIDAFQNPPAPAAAPAAVAPARPATTDYLDAWATDNVPRNTTPASAVNASTFEPRHQRVDSSGLVTVNLS